VECVEGEGALYCGICPHISIVGPITPTQWGTVQDSRVLAIGRHLLVLVLGGVLVLAPSTLTYTSQRY
jgi:hypothetical protein